MDGDGVEDSSKLNLTSTMGSVLTNNKNKESVSTSSGSCSSDSTPNKVASNVSKKNIKSDVDNEADLFANECNISDVSVEKITENVDDIVSDLESLLGGPTDFSTVGKSEIKPAKVDLSEERTSLYFGSSILVNPKNVSKIGGKDNEKSANVEEKKDVDDIVRPEINIDEVPSISLVCNKVPEVENFTEDSNVPGISAPEVKMVVEEIHILDNKSNIQDANNFNKEICKKNDEILEEKCSSSDNIHQTKSDNIEEYTRSSEIKDSNCDVMLPIENTQNDSIVESESVLNLDKDEISTIQADHSDQLLIENTESSEKNIEKNENLTPDLITASTRIISTTSTDDYNKNMDGVENTELPEFIEKEIVEETNSSELELVENKDEKCSSMEIENQDDTLISNISTSSDKNQITLHTEYTKLETDEVNLNKVEISTAENVTDNCDETMTQNDEKCNVECETMETNTSLSENIQEDLLVHKEKNTDLSTSPYKILNNDVIANKSEDVEQKYEFRQKNDNADDKNIDSIGSEIIPCNELQVIKTQNSEMLNSVIDIQPQQSTSMLYEETNIKITDSKEANIDENSQGYKNDNLECNNIQTYEATSKNDVADDNVQMEAEMREDDQKVNINTENKCLDLEIESFQSINCKNIEQPLESLNIQEINNFVEDVKYNPLDDHEVQSVKAGISPKVENEFEKKSPQDTEINMEIENDDQICFSEKSADDGMHVINTCINDAKFTDLSQLKEITDKEIVNKEVIPSEVLSKIKIIDDIKAESSVISDTQIPSDRDTEIKENVEQINDAELLTKPEIKSSKVCMVLLHDSVNTSMESESEQAILNKTEIISNIVIEKNLEKPNLETESILSISENIEITTVKSGQIEPELLKTNLDDIDIPFENCNSNETCEENNVQYNKNVMEVSCEGNDKQISDNSSITDHNNDFDCRKGPVGNEATQMMQINNSNKFEGDESDVISDKQHVDDSGKQYCMAETNISPECKIGSLSSEMEECNEDQEDVVETMQICKEIDNSTQGEISKFSIAPDIEKLNFDTKQISSNTKSGNPCDKEYQRNNIYSETNVLKVEEKSEIFHNSISDNITSTSELINSCMDVNISDIPEHKNEMEAALKVNEIKEVEIVEKDNSFNKVVCIKQSEEFEQYINVTSENEKLDSAIDDQAEEKIFEFSSDKEEMNSDMEESDQTSMCLNEPETKHIHLNKIDAVTTKSENNDNEEYIKESNYSQDDELLKAALEASCEEEKPISKEDRPIIEVFDKERIKSSSILEDIEERNKHEENVLIQAAADAENNRLNHNYEKPLNIVVDPPIDEISIVKEVECLNKTETEIYNKQGGEYSSKISQNLKLTITKNKSEEKSILKIVDPKESDISVVEISPSESESEETPIPKFLIKQSQKMMSPLKITIKPVIKPEEQTQKSSPKLIIKPIIKPDEESMREEKLHHSPKITIKPIPKPNSEEIERCNSPKITIKPIIKPIETSMSPKIKIKPIIKPADDAKEEMEERIVLKITKNNISHTEVKKEENEKLAKIKLKFYKDNRHAHIVNEKDKTDEKCVKRVIQDSSNEMTEDNVSSSKRLKFDVTIEESATVSHIDVDHDEHKGDNLDNVIPVLGADTENQDSNSSPIPTPRKRGRPRKNPLVVREEFKDIKEEVVQIEEIQESPSGRPKRSCRGPSVRTTLGIKPRKARGAARSRGRGRGMSTRGQIKNDNEAQKEISDSKIKLLKEAAVSARVTESLDNQDVEMKEILEIPTETIVIEDSNEEKLEIENKSIITKSADVMIFEDETRMSAEINSRAQTPAKQVSMDVIEESQSSIQSTATTESTKIRKGTKMEIALEPEGAIISADQLAEYYWGGGGPYMLQEQVAQFLGIKSFKRKYPGIQRRTVDMQERDFIRESSLASEHMCDLGLTAVNSVDILDIMYSDFQNKYEEYCKHQRDRQTKDITNKQKALSLAASQEKNKLDIMQQAVESAAQWNYNFNKSRKEERIACMDLQTYTINYPKGRFKQINKPKLGYYPMALVPGQYTDFYKTFTPTELNNLPLSTMLYHEINTNNEEDSQSDNSASDSDSSSSGSDSSDSDSSDETDCNLCTPSNAKKVVT